MSQRSKDAAPDAVPVPSSTDHELGRALDRAEARRLEERILTDRELERAAARPTLPPVDACDQPRVVRAATHAAPPKNLFGGTVRGLPAAAQKLAATSDAPSSWRGTAGEEHIDATPSATSISVVARRGTEANPHAESRPVAVRDEAPARRRREGGSVTAPEKAEGRRFLFLAALLVVVPVTILLISRAVNPEPLFRAASSQPGVGALHPNSGGAEPMNEANQGAPAAALPVGVEIDESAGAQVSAAPSAEVLPRMPATTSLTASPSVRNTTAARTPTATNPPTSSSTTPTSAPTTTTSTSGVEPFFKRAQP